MEHMGHMEHAGHDHGAAMQHDHGGGDVADGECVFYHALVFHAGVCQEILFPGWRTHNALEVFGSALALFLAGLLYEGLKYCREALHTRGVRPAKDSQVNITKTECGANGNCGQTVVRYTMFSGGHMVQTALHVVQATASYVLMLVFMTYNVWLCGGLVLGLGAGYFLFGWRRHTVVDATEHCQ